MATARELRLTLPEVLFAQGFGTRRACRALVEQGAVTVAGSESRDAERTYLAHGLEFTVCGEPWRFRAHACLMMYKPAGTECSHRPGAWPSVYSLLPPPLRQRPRPGGVAGVQAVGRLDQDTTGLLLLTDDGTLIHRLNSPRHHVPKVYEVGTAEAVDARQVARLLAGVTLDDEPLPVRAAQCSITASHRLQLTLTEGKYHQVKRMIAALGNRVVSLHRSRVGPLQLPPEMRPGEFCWLDEAQVAALRDGGASARAGAP